MEAQRERYKARNGVLVVLEGIDGSGKRTLVHLLASALQQRGVDCSVYSYPDYGSEFGKIIRQFLDEQIELNTTAQFLLYLLDMVKDVESVVADLSRGRVVIMDRYFPATIAYQCAGGFDYEAAKKIVGLIGLPKPDLLFYIDVPVGVSLARKRIQKGRLDRFERSSEFQATVAENYQRLCSENFPSKWVRLDGTERPDRLARKLLSVVMKALRGGAKGWE